MKTKWHWALRLPARHSCRASCPVRTSVETSLRTPDLVEPELPPASGGGQAKACPTSKDLGPTGGACFSLPAATCRSWVSSFSSTARSRGATSGVRSLDGFDLLEWRRVRIGNVDSGVACRSLDRLFPCQLRTLRRGGSLFLCPNQLQELLSGFIGKARNLLHQDFLRRGHGCPLPSHGESGSTIAIFGLPHPGAESCGAPWPSPILR